MQPQKVWVIIFCKVQNLHLMQELICFSPFLYHYIDSSVFLEVAKNGAIAPQICHFNRQHKMIKPVYLDKIYLLATYFHLLLIMELIMQTYHTSDDYTKKFLNRSMD